MPYPVLKLYIHSFLKDSRQASLHEAYMLFRHS